jgi:cytochrome c oxidase assembly protein subunit 15
MTHRLGALLAFLVLGGLGLAARAGGGHLRRGGNTLLALLVLEAGLGLGAVAAGLPLLIATAHNAGAALLLLAVVNLNLIPAPRTTP